MSAGLWILVAAVVLAAVIGVAKWWYDGRFRPVRHGGAAAEQPGVEEPPPVHLDEDRGIAEFGATKATHLGPDELGGAELGPRATLVQFSSAFCAPCRATRRVLDEVSELVGGVTYVEIDAESNLDLVRRLDIRRTPTVLVLDREGRITTRASGQPRKPDVIAALGRLV